MAKNSLIVFGLNIVVLLVVVLSCPRMIVEVKGFTCKAYYVGLCGDGCFQVCKATHPGREVLKVECSPPTNNPPICGCDYSCGDQCEDIIDIGTPCNNVDAAETCDKACNGKHLRPNKSIGRCVYNSTSSQYVCNYNC